jgi:hypothetical protein
MSRGQEAVTRTGGNDDGLWLRYATPVSTEGRDRCCSEPANDPLMARGLAAVIDCGVRRDAVAVFVGRDVMMLPVRAADPCLRQARLRG